MERGFRNFRRERSGSRLRLLLLFFVFALFPAIISGSAFAQITTVGNPANMTIDLFDYWFYKEDGSIGSRYKNSGINYGHSLWFLSDSSVSNGRQAWNVYTRDYRKFYPGIVEPFLEDGYPKLAVGNKESLKYLFDLTPLTDEQDRPVKDVYPDIHSIYTVDENGYYVFDSSIHKVKMNDSGQLDISMWPQSVGSGNRGFFPFDPDGNKASENKPQGWFFGAHIQSEFSIPYNHMVLNPSGVYEPMAYNFLGDDDVWVFMNGVLIGDVGGIHNKYRLDIDFLNGTVTTQNKKEEGYDPHNTLETKNLWDIVYAAFLTKYDGDTAKAREAALAQFDWDDNEHPKTFAGGSYIKMDFFYLERGGGNSNMRMYYNLVSTYHFTAHKSLHRNTGQQVLQKKQFNYKLTGYPQTDDTGKVIMEAVMPKYKPDSTINEWYPNYDTITHTLLEDDVRQQPFLKTLVTKNSEDGNVNFGNVDLKGTYDDPTSELGRYVGQTFRYVLEELPPDGAAQINDNGPYFWDDPTKLVYRNQNGKLEFDGVEYDDPPPGVKYCGDYSYKGETVQPGPRCTYNFDGITYDNSVIYYEGTVTVDDCSVCKKCAVCEEGHACIECDKCRECEADRDFWLSKTYYTDHTYSLRKNIYFAAFDNWYDTVSRVDLFAKKEVITYHDEDVLPGLSQFEFELVDITDPAKPDPIDPRPGYYYPSNSEDRNVTFNPIYYTLPDNAQTGYTETHVYTIKEKPGDSDRIDYSETVYYAQVSLTKTGDGKVSAEIKYYSDPDCTQEIHTDYPTFINEEIVERKLTVVKIVDGNIGSKNKPFTFTLSVPDKKNQTVEYSINDGEKVSDVCYDANGSRSFSLSHGQSMTFYGVTGTFSVSEITDDGYATSWYYSDDPDTVFKTKTAAERMTVDFPTITFTNTLDAPIPTGVRVELAPALTGAGAAVLLLLVLCVGKVRKEDND